MKVRPSVKKIKDTDLFVRRRNKTGGKGILKIINKRMPKNKQRQG